MTDYDRNDSDNGESGAALADSQKGPVKLVIGVGIAMLAMVIYIFAVVFGGSFRH